MNDTPDSTAVENVNGPRIVVIGVGGAGGNAVNNMIRSELAGVEFVVANTDAQAIAQSLCETCVQMGRSLTRGLGAGARPDVGRAAAEEALDDIVAHLEGANMAFITAGMGGGTGTGGASVIARAAREAGILTVGVVTKPFHFEGVQRMRLAEQGIQELTEYVDTLIIIPNQNLFRVANEKTTFADAFKMADDVLNAGVRGVTDLMVMPGLINLDFADIRTVMTEMGKAIMGTGEADSDGRATAAAEAAINNPLLDEISMKGARGVLINITGGLDMTLFEVDQAANRIRDEVDPEANIIFGSTFDQRLEGRMRVSVVATGIGADEETKARARSVPLSLVISRSREKTPAASETPAPAPAEEKAGDAAAAEAAETAAEAAESEPEEAAPAAPEAAAVGDADQEDAPEAPPEAPPVPATAGPIGLRAALRRTAADSSGTAQAEAPDVAPPQGAETKPHPAWSKPFSSRDRDRASTETNPAATPRPLAGAPSTEEAPKQPAAARPVLGLPKEAAGREEAESDDGPTEEEALDSEPSVKRRGNPLFSWLSGGNAGNAEEFYEKGERYYYGQGVRKNYALALRNYRRAAELGHAAAQNRLGWMYEKGEGTEADNAEAVAWYRRAAEQGHINAMNDLGYMYRQGWGVPQSYGEALRWFRKAAEKYDSYAEYNMGQMYENGWGVAKDMDEAVRWFRRAAARGHEWATKRLDELGVKT